MSGQSTTADSPHFDWDELARTAGGRWEVAPAADTGGVCDVTDNSQKVGAGALFVAIPGETTDGHAHAGAALASGAAGLCLREGQAVDAAVLTRARADGRAVLRVADTLAAFHELARAHRQRFHNLRVVAVTGSSGKTSTKEFIAAVLEAAWPGAVLKTEGNTNNHFGVPRNLLRLRATHRVAVLELGSNHPGEIATLARLVCPDVALITSVGRCHLEFFGDTAGVALEKGSLFRAVSREGVCVFPADVAHRDILEKLAGGRRLVTFGTPADADVRVTYTGLVAEDPDLYEAVLQWRRPATRQTLRWPVGGAHQAGNAAGAVAVGTVLGVAPALAVAALAQASLPGMRMARREVAGVTWVNDAYNACPDSMEASLRWFHERTAKVPAGRRFVVLGDMLEVGTTVLAEHRQALELATRGLPGLEVLAVGPTMSEAGAACGVRTFADTAAARAHLAAVLVPGSWVLVKGSRRMRMESVLPPAEG